MIEETFVVCIISVKLIERTNIAGGFRTLGNKVYTYIKKKRNIYYHLSTSAKNELRHKGAQLWKAGWPTFALKLLLLLLSSIIHHELSPCNDDGRGLLIANDLAWLLLLLFLI